MAKAARQRARSNAPVPVSPDADDVQSPMLVLAVITVIGAILRTSYLRQPIRYDEAVTYLSFARLPWREAIAYYPAPNNHVFHTLLVKMAVGVFGNDPWALRLPAFVAGVATIPATFYAARALYGQRIALLASALVAGSGALTLYATNARGYGIVVLATLMLVVVGTRARRSASLWPWVAYAIIGALGLWTVPVMLHPLGGVSLWLAWSMWREPAADAANTGGVTRVLLATAAACALGALLYTPIILRSGVSVLSGNSFVTPSSLAVFFGELPKGIADTVRLFALGAPLPMALLLAACAIAGVMYHRRFSKTSLPLLAVMAGWSAVVLLTNHRVPYVRVWLFLLPMLLMLAAVGAVALFARGLARSARAAWAASLTAVGVALVLAATVVASGAVRASRETGSFVDAEAVAVKLKTELRAGDRVVTTTVTNMPLSYWMFRLGVDSAFTTIAADQAQRFLLIVNSGDGESESGELLRRRFVNNPALAEPVTVAEFPHSKVIAVAKR